MKQVIRTHQAAQPSGTYSQAIKTANFVFLAGQIGLHPETNKLVEGGIEAQLRQTWENVKAVVVAAGGDLQQIVKITVFLQDLAHAPLVNQSMQAHFTEPYPARSMVQVAALPKQALVEIEAILVLGD